MPTYYYYNTLNNKVFTTSVINFCQKCGPISECRAASIEDQHGCKYRRPSPRRKCCMYYREDLHSACDNPYAQAGVSAPLPDLENLTDKELNCDMCDKYETCSLRKDEDKEVCNPGQMRNEIERTVKAKK